MPTSTESLPIRRSLSASRALRGLRLTVRRVLEVLAALLDREGLRAEYPELEDEDIRQALEYAAANLDYWVVELRPGAHPGASPTPYELSPSGSGPAPLHGCGTRRPRASRQSTLATSACRGQPMPISYALPR